MKKMLWNQYCIHHQKNIGRGQADHLVLPIYGLWPMSDVYAYFVVFYEHYAMLGQCQCIDTYHLLCKCFDHLRIQFPSVHMQISGFSGGFWTETSIASQMVYYHLTKLPWTNVYQFFGAYHPSIWQFWWLTIQTSLLVFRVPGNDNKTHDNETTIQWWGHIFLLDWQFEFVFFLSIACNQLQHTIKNLNDCCICWTYHSILFLIEQFVFFLDRNHFWCFLFGQFWNTWYLQFGFFWVSLFLVVVDVSVGLFFVTPCYIELVYFENVLCIDWIIDLFLDQILWYPNSLWNLNSAVQNHLGEIFSLISLYKIYKFFLILWWWFWIWGNKYLESNLVQCLIFWFFLFCGKLYTQWLVFWLFLIYR